MRIAIYARPTPDNHPDYLRLLCTQLSDKGVELIVFEGYYQWLKQHYNFEIDLPVFSDEFVPDSSIEMVLSLGGDGTMLETLKFVRDSMVPVLGVNTGRLGFLASVAKQDLEEVCGKILARKFELDKRSILELVNGKELFGGLPYAINEITVHKKDSSSMISIDAFVDEEFLNSYWADGLIVSTATGSTAYSLSCGGPIMIPGSGNFCITPIAPHNLNVRPIVLGNNHELTLQVKGRAQEFMVSLDSRNAVIENTRKLKVRKADFTFNLIKLEGLSFFNTLRNKLLWGLDKRN
jgi:NAD+ kinase